MNSTRFQERDLVAKQGLSLSEHEIRTIIDLLGSTDMTIYEIATRMECSRSTVAFVNRRYKVRDYGGLRSRWKHHEQKTTSYLK